MMGITYCIRCRTRLSTNGVDLGLYPTDNCKIVLTSVYICYTLQFKWHIADTINRWGSWFSYRENGLKSELFSASHG